MHNPFRYFTSSPEVIRLAVMMYVRYPLSLSNAQLFLQPRADGAVPVGNESGLVGKYLMEHPHLFDAGEVVFDDDFDRQSRPADFGGVRHALVPDDQQMRRHVPAGPHGGAGAPAEFALRTCALGRHSWLPTHRRAFAVAHSACLSRPPERMWTDAACSRPPQGGTQSMTPHETGSTVTPGAPRAAPPPRTFGPQGPTLGDLIDAYLQDYQVRQFRSHSTARENGGATLDHSAAG